MDGPAVLQFCTLCPEHLVDDLLAVVLFVSRFSPKTLAQVPLGEYFTFLIDIVAKPQLLSSPHLRSVRVWGL